MKHGKLRRICSPFMESSMGLWEMVLEDVLCWDGLVRLHKWCGGMIIFTKFMCSKMWWRRV